MSVFSSTALNATNKVAALLEACYLFQISEKALDPAQNNIQITVDDDNGNISIQGTLPVAISYDASGNLVVTANDITGKAIVPEGDVKATNESALVLEMFQMMVASEDSESSSNPDFIALAALSVDSNTELASFNTTIPFTSSLVAGLPTLTATDYLS